MKIKLGLFFIIILAFLLRSYRLDSFPALNPDEAALGYNAYSLIKTGKDESGATFPLHFRSFSDYKPGGYVYLSLPFIYFLDINTLAIRLPNLILSVISLYFLFKIILELTSKPPLALLTTFLIAISPWHIHFSRGAWESGSALSITIIATYFFLKNKHLLSALFFSLSMYTYHSSRIFTPLLVLSLFFIVKKFPKFFTILLILFTLPALFSFLKNGGSARFGGVGLSADQGPVWRANELINQHANTKLINRITHNKRLLYAISWAEKYTSHFNLNFLYINGDAVPRSKVPEMGQIYLFLIPFTLYGGYLLVHSKERKLKVLIFSWLVFAPLASSLTFQAPSALRSLAMCVPLEFLNAMGLYNAFKKINPKFINLVNFLFYIVVFWSVAYYLNSYYNRYQNELSSSWPWTAKKSIEQQKYTQIDADQPYIMYLFYTKYDPGKLQAQIKLTNPDQYGFSTVEQIDDIKFKPIK